MSAAITPGTRPTWNSAITGTRYTNCGRVCMPSRIGRIARCTRSLRAAQMPRGIAIATDTITPTITCDRVSIAASHIPANPINAMHRNEAIASGIRRAAAYAAAAAPRHTIHHGRPNSSFWSGSSANRTETSVTPVVNPPKCRTMRSAVSSTGPAIFTTHASGKSCWRSTWRPTITAMITTPSASSAATLRDTTHPKRRTVGAPRVLRSRWLHP